MCKNKSISNRVVANPPCFNGVVLLAAVLLVQQAWCDITLLDANYKVESFAEYQQGDFSGRAKYITADDSGNVYITHDSSDLLRADSSGDVSVFSNGFNNLQGVSWGGCTAYGGSLYVAEVDTKSIQKIDASGTAMTFRSLPEQPLVVEIDRTGNYGNQLYAATRNSTIVYSISETGSLSELVNLSTLTDGDPLDMAFDTTGRYNGQLYLSLFEVDNTNYQGILSIDPQGNVSQFLAGGYWGTYLEFDTTSELVFGGDLFIGGSGVIKRLTPAGDRISFLTSDRFIKDYAFGSDGSLYIMEVDSGSALTGTVTITKITQVPEPASLLLLSFGAFTACLRSRKK